MMVMLSLLRSMLRENRCAVLQFDLGSGCEISMGNDGLCSSDDVRQRVHRTIETDGAIWCAPYVRQELMYLSKLD